MEEAKKVMTPEEKKAAEEKKAEERYRALAKPGYRAHKCRKLHWWVLKYAPQRRKGREDEEERNQGKGRR